MRGKPILVNMEESGVITDALIAAGYDAWSCDLKPTRGKNPHRHIQGDAIAAMKSRKWFSMIAHPVCDDIANSGAKHYYMGKKRWNDDGTENPRDPVKWQGMLDGVEFFKEFYYSNIEIKAIENSIMIGHAKERIGCGKQDQTTQPYWFGDKEKKGTCWWLHGLPLLEKTDYIAPPPPGSEEAKLWEKCFRMAPGPNRKRDRAKTLQGIADAIVIQWGPYLSGELKHELNVSEESE
jgi:hypothetical protein